MPGKNPRPRIYLDTSVPSHLFDMEPPEKTLDTWRLWHKIWNNNFKASISSATQKELHGGIGPKLTLILGALDLVKLEFLIISDEVEKLARSYVAGKVLGDETEKSYDDCVHMAFASIKGHDALVSWNFKHLVKEETMARALRINKKAGCGRLVIVSPTRLLAEGVPK